MLSRHSKASEPREHARKLFLARRRSAHRVSSREAILVLSRVIALFTVPNKNKELLIVYLNSDPMYVCIAVTVNPRFS